eukprot:442995_1
MSLLILYHISLSIIQLAQSQTSSSQTFLCGSNICNTQFIFTDKYYADKVTFVCPNKFDCDSLVVYSAVNIEIDCYDPISCNSAQIFCGSYVPPGNKYDKTDFEAKDISCTVKCNDQWGEACSNTTLSCKSDGVKTCQMISVQSNSIDSSTLECNIGHNDTCQMDCTGGCTNSKLICHESSNCDCINCGIDVNITYITNQTNNPTISPSINPTINPSNIPSNSPTNIPSESVSSTVNIISTFIPYSTLSTFTSFSESISTIVTDEIIYYNATWENKHYFWLSMVMIICIGILIFMTIHKFFGRSEGSDILKKIRFIALFQMFGFFLSYLSWMICILILYNNNNNHSRFIYIFVAVFEYFGWIIGWMCFYLLL